MISIGKLRSADYYEREVVDGAEDYYVRPGEAPGRWVGNLAAELGLEGTVDGDHLAALFELRHPHTGEPLLDTNATKPGFDLTISAPKSVSLLWALGDEDRAAQVEDSLGQPSRTPRGSWRRAHAPLAGATPAHSSRTAPASSERRSSIAQAGLLIPAFTSTFS